MQRIHPQALALPRRAALALLLASALGMVLRPGGPAEDAAPAAGDGGAWTTIFLFRHAERDDLENPADPGLTERGHERARAIAAMLADVEVTHLFSTPYRRTKLTLAPLVEATGLEIQEFKAFDQADHVAALQTLPAGSVAVVSGHRNTVPQFLAAFGLEATGEGIVKQPPPAGDVLDKPIYDRYWIVLVPPPGLADRTRPQLLQMHFES